MALENALVYRILTGDDTYPHSGNFTVGVAGKITIDDSDGNDDGIFGDFTHTGGADEPDQDVTASTVAGIGIGDTVDLRYKYTVTGSDGSSGTVYFIASNAAANYGPIMVSDFPLDPTVTYTFGTFNTDGAAPYSSLVPCFGKSTQIETKTGPVPVERLRVGDLVRTLDHGHQPIRWIGSKKLDLIDLAMRPKLLPIRIAKGALGPDTPSRDLLVSPQHRVLVRSRIAQRMFDTGEVLIPANKLLELDGVNVAKGVKQVEYFHLLFDGHQIIFSDGAMTESLFTGPEAMKAVGKDARMEIVALFPQIFAQSYVAKRARPIPDKGKKMLRLVTRHADNRQALQ